MIAKPAKAPGRSWLLAPCVTVPAGSVEGRAEKYAVGGMTLHPVQTARAAMKSKTCPCCGDVFTRTTEAKHNWKTKKTCGKRCASVLANQRRKKVMEGLTTAEKKVRSARMARAKQENAEGKRAPKKSYYVTVEHEDADCYHPKNVEQREFDKAVDARHYLTFESRIIKPGDPDFEALCKKITPNERVRKSERSTTIFAEIDGDDNRYRRLEESNTLRG